MDSISYQRNTFIFFSIIKKRITTNFPKTEGKFFFAYSPIARGLLTDNYENVLNSNQPAIKRKIKNLNQKRYFKILEILKGKTKKENLNIAQLSIKELIQKNKNIIPIIGTTSKNHFDEIFEVVKN